jgi:hypothetical protein
VSTNHDEDGPAPARGRWLCGLAGVLAIPAAVIWWPGCREYPAVTSREGMYHMQLLYTAANTRDPARLERVERGVEKLSQEGKLTPAEREAFGSIIGQARAGDWAAAEAAAFKFAQDQVGRGHPAPDDPDHHDKKKAGPRR